MRSTLRSKKRCLAPVPGNCPSGRLTGQAWSSPCPWIVSPSATASSVSPIPSSCLSRSRGVVTLHPRYFVKTAMCGSDQRFLRLLHPAGCHRRDPGAAGFAHLGVLLWRPRPAARQRHLKEFRHLRRPLLREPGGPDHPTDPSADLLQDHDRGGSRPRTKAR